MITHHKILDTINYENNFRDHSYMVFELKRVDRETMKDLNNLSNEMAWGIF